MASSNQRKRMRRKRILKKRRRRSHEEQVNASSSSSSSSSSLSLPQDVVEELFLRLPLKAIIRLKSLSKQWRLTIESLSFAERHLKIAERSRLNRPQFMIVTEEDPLKGMPRYDTDVGFRTICLETSKLLSFTRLNFPQGFFHYTYVSQSCDGLFCIHSPRSHAVYVVNPATRWRRLLPPARFQILMHKFDPTSSDWRDMESVFHLAFMKSTDYKLVWLYNSDKFNADASSPIKGVTKCEVFDFRANAWRYLACTPSYRIYHDQTPVYANGSVYWFTEPYNDRIQVVVLDIHTETFRLLPKLIPAIATSDPRRVDMCTLDNRLCMSIREPVTMLQVIWRLHPSEDAWERIFTIDLLSCSSSRTEFIDGFNWRDKNVVEPASPVAICKNMKILLSHSRSRGLVKYDFLTKSLEFMFRHNLGWRKVTYFESLISHI